MPAVEVVLVAGMAVAACVTVFAGWLGGRDDRPDPDVSDWYRTHAEVVSVLRAGERTFLTVRFSVGTSVVQNDVRYGFAGPVPYAGRRVTVWYDPNSPARVVLDPYPDGRVTSLR